MKRGNMWLFILGALVLALLAFVRIKFGAGANTAIASFSLTSTVIYAGYFIQNIARKAERNKRSL